MKHLLTILVLLPPFLCFSQNFIPTQRRAIAKPTNQELYNVEFELKHYVFVNGDSTLLDGINFELLPAQREQSVDVEVYDPTIDQIIIIYSYDKIEAKYLEKSGH